MKPFLLAALGIILSSAALSASDRPNIIIVMTDDQGYGDLGYTGNPVLETPHLDAMAARSTRVEPFYVSPVCTPTRASLMTGRYHMRTKAVDTFRGRAMMDPDEITIPEVLKASGYATGIFGKWHLGDCYPMRPQDQGFEESLVHWGGGIAQPSEPLANERRYTDAILSHNGEEVQTKGYCTDVYFDAALKWMKKAKDAGNPFFAYIPPNAPHDPLHDIPEELYQKYKKKDLSPILRGNDKFADRIARIYAMVDNIDANMGKLFEGLKELDLYENTLCLFLLDNGPHNNRYVAGFRGLKSSVYEGGIRSPTLFHWPKQLKAGHRVKQMAAHIDVMPTVLEAAGASLPQTKIDGRSLLPLLKGETVEWPDRSIVIQAHRGNASERYHHFMIRRGSWKLLRHSGFQKESAPAKTPFELYNLEEDPGELWDQAKQYPQKVSDLKAEYNRWFDQITTTRRDNFAPPRIVLGTAHEKRTRLTRQDWRTGESPGWGKQGRWLVKIAKESTYRVEVILDKESKGQGKLQVGDQAFEKALSESDRHLNFDAITFSPGDKAISFSFESPQSDKKVEAYQVILSQISS